MDFIYILGAVVIVAYILQIIFGLKQLKHFNTTYSELRKKVVWLSDVDQEKSRLVPLSCLQWIGRA